MTMRVGKVKYNPLDKSAEQPIYKQQQKKKLPPLLGNFESVALPRTGYIPFSSENFADERSFNSTMSSK